MAVAALVSAGRAQAADGGSLVGRIHLCPGDAPVAVSIRFVNTNATDDFTIASDATGRFGRVFVPSGDYVAAIWTPQLEPATLLFRMSTDDRVTLDVPVEPRQDRRGDRLRCRATVTTSPSTVNRYIIRTST